MQVRDVSITCGKCKTVLAWGVNPGNGIGDVYELGLHDSVTSAKAIPAHPSFAQFQRAKSKVKHLVDGKGKVTHTIV
jgi:hypothetical protein